MNERLMSSPRRKVSAAARLFGAVALGLVTAVSHAQYAAPPAGAPLDTFAAAPAPRYLNPIQLRELVAPIALYPDELLGLVLPAATDPLGVVQAARYLDRAADDPGLEPDPNWDDAIVALLNYPEVLRMMEQDLVWTERLGEAVVTQQGDVLDAVAAFREVAQAAGNLRSDAYQIVENDRGAISIRPATPAVVHVPYYEPARVLTYQPEPALLYYTRAYPSYYYPYGYSALSGYDNFWGVSSIFSISWGSRQLWVRGHRHYDTRFYDRPRRGQHFRREQRAGDHPHRHDYRDQHQRRDTTRVGDRGRQWQREAMASRNHSRRGSDGERTARRDDHSDAATRQRAPGSRHNPADRRATPSPQRQWRDGTATAGTAAGLRQPRAASGANRAVDNPPPASRPRASAPAAIPRAPVQSFAGPAATPTPRTAPRDRADRTPATTRSAPAQGFVVPRAAADERARVQGIVPAPSARPDATVAAPAPAASRRSRTETVSDTGRREARQGNAEYARSDRRGASNRGLQSTPAAPRASSRAGIPNMGSMAADAVRRRDR